ncbi:MAG: response regulator [Candidatus Omnitrophica bacterium]|nr:response regulator [Candidatus Omnitrophota bacterium]MCK5260412.1 response regulator [Candidatus Omnitrophota bacterium]
MSGSKILIVDDEEDIRKTIVYQLKAIGYEVIIAQDGEEGLQKARGETPDLIILDLMLPKIDGHKVCGLLKNDARYKGIPIILFTARVQKEDVELSKEVGADAYITKPFETSDLIGKVKELLEKEGS